MSAALWLGTYLLHSSVLCGSVLLFRRRLRRMDGSEHLWRAAMLLPLVSATITRVYGAGLWEIGLADSAPVAGLSGAPDAVAVLSWSALDVATAAAILCFTVGVLLVARDWAAHAAFVRNLGGRTPAGPDVTRRVADLLRPDAKGPIVLTVAPGAASPIVVGRREICLPVRAARDLTHDQFRALVAHEVAHVIRGDSFWFSAMASLESALFVQPLNRIGRRELRHLAELSCDAWAARTVSNPIAVAQCLIEVAGWTRRVSPAAVPAAASRNGLTERVQRLLAPSVPRFHIAALPCLLLVLLASLALPGFAPVQQSGSERSADYIRGYELARAYLARNDASAPAQAGRHDTGRSATLKRRAEIEQRLKAKLRLE